MMARTRGHWRNQPCGPGGRDRKLVWVGPPTGPVIPEASLAVDPLTEMLNRSRDRLAAKYAQVSDIDSIPGPVRWQTLRHDPSGRWRAGDVGFEVANSYPEKYDRMLLLPQGEFFFHANEVERVAKATSAFFLPCGHVVEVAWPEDWVDGLVVCACRQWYLVNHDGEATMTDAAKAERDVDRAVLMGHFDPLPMTRVTTLIAKIRDGLLACPGVQADPEAVARLSDLEWVAALVRGQEQSPA